jgi:hypothetical protein
MWFSNQVLHKTEYLGHVFLLLAFYFLQRLNASGSKLRPQNIIRIGVVAGFVWKCHDIYLLAQFVFGDQINTVRVCFHHHVRLRANLVMKFRRFNRDSGAVHHVQRASFENYFCHCRVRHRNPQPLAS